VLFPIGLRACGKTWPRTVNDQFQNIATETESLADQIGLQAEGGEMEFRKIELTPIEQRDGKNDFALPGMARDRWAIGGLLTAGNGPEIVDSLEYNRTIHWRIGIFILASEWIENLD
jgi:hypothetical protein